MLVCCFCLDGFRCMKRGRLIKLQLMISHPCDLKSIYYTYCVIKGSSFNFLASSH